MQVRQGFTDAERPIVAAAFWEAFRAKLHKLLGPDERALPFLQEALDPAFALCARDDEGRLLGTAGFKTSQGSLVAGGMPDLIDAFGWSGALWRGPLLGLLERDVEPGVLLMDGIFVLEHARGRGVGTTLIRAIRALAQSRGLTSVRLDVIDTNPRARALYEREGFVAASTTDIGPLEHLFGFRRSTEMRCPIHQGPSHG